jgi:tRNA(Ile)-lysidine synthase
MRRDDLRLWLTSLGQSWREDSSNADTTRLRARLRIELLPQLERNFQRQVVARLGSLAELAREEEAFWSALVDERFRAVTAQRAPSVEHGIEGSIEAGVGDLLKPLAGLPAAASAALSRRLLRRILEAVTGDCRGLTFAHIEQVLHLARESTSGRRVMLPRGVVVEKSFDRLIFSADQHRGGSPGTENAAAPSYEYAVELPTRGATRVTIPAIQRCLCLKVVDWPPAQSDTKSSAEALDADLLHPPFLLRNWQPGDIYRPRGRRRARKVKFLFRESRIAARDRPAWPVLTSRGRLVWVPGLPVAEEFAAGRRTRVGLLITEEAI